MPASRGSAFDRLLGRLGGLLEDVEYSGRGKHGAAELGSEAQHVATAWILGRTLRPRHINWPRLIAATATGVVLGEVVEALVSSRRPGRRLPPGRTRILEDDDLERDADAYALETDEMLVTGSDALLDAQQPDLGPRSARRTAEAESGPEDEGVFDEAEESFVEEMEPVGPRSRRATLAAAEEDEVQDVSYHVRHILERAGGDLAVAAAYASVVYPRLPGPRWLRAAAFAAGDIALSSGGGIAATLAGLSPRSRLPLARLLSDEERRVEHSLALALALAVIYRDEDEEDDEDED